MTGAEIVAAGTAAAKGAQSVGKMVVSDKERALILDASKETPGFQVAAEEVGHRMAAKQLAINKVLKPVFSFAGYQREYFTERFAADLAEKLADVSADDVVAPKPNVAAQAIQGLSYSLDEPDLKEMYLNLLATASQVQRRDQAHPSFAEIIRQLTQVEASLLPYHLRNSLGQAMAEIRYTHSETFEYHVIERHVPSVKMVLDDSPWSDPHWPIYVDNWVRLGLVDVDYGKHKAGDHQYDFIETRPEYRRALARTDPPEGYEVTFQKGVMTATAFGLRFAAAVIPPASPVPSSANGN